MNMIHLSELTWNNVGEWPLVVKIGVLLGTGFLILAMGYWLIVRESLIQFETLKEQEITLKSDFERKQRQLCYLPTYRAQIKTLTKHFTLVLTQLPEKNEVPDLLEEISRAGVVSGLRFELFSPQPEVMRDFYVELPIRISVVGSYFQLAMFISRVAEMTRIVTFHDFSIEGQPSKDYEVISDDTLLMNIIVKIYRYRAS